MRIIDTAVVFVHGIGPPRRVPDELAAWTRALADGARAAGHSAFAAGLDSGAVPAEFVHYADLFGRPQAQGAGLDLPDDEAQELAALMLEVIDAQLTEADDPEWAATLRRARHQLVPPGQEAGLLAPIRQAINAATTLLAFGPLSRAGQWIGGKLLVRDFAQVTRYLARAEPDESGRDLDARIRQRLHDAIGGRRVVLIAHSLGSVVGWETLHEHTEEVPLLVTLGSPLAMRTVVWPHLVPQPPATPPGVRRWINLWDKDDIIVARSQLAKDIRANALGVRPESSRIDSDGVWVHSATKYLCKPDLAGPVAEAVAAGAGTIP